MPQAKGFPRRNEITNMYCILGMPKGFSFYVCMYVYIYVCVAGYQNQSFIHARQMLYH
jgi:hypothetical protein